MNPERMSKDQNKKEFARFVEDFNTGACSHFPLGDFRSIDVGAKKLQPRFPTKSFTI
jgi:hypothetical protein